MLPWIRTTSVSQKIVVTIGVVAAFFVFSFIFFTPHVVVAQTDTFGVQQVNNTIALNNADIRITVAKIIRAVFALLGTIALGLILYAGYTIMTSGGSEEKIAEGKKILINAVIGLTIILSALIITQFVLNSLNQAINGGTATDETGAPTVQFATFGGSGALGGIIKDHYPMFHQKNVARNTKIAVTFSEAMDPSSFIGNKNNSCWGPDNAPTSTPAICGAADAIPYFGDCLDTNNDGTIDWINECDQLTTSSIKIFFSDDKANINKPVFEAAALAVYGADKKAYSFVFKPLQNLGSSTKNVWHTVDLLKGIKKLDGKGAFDNQFYKHYQWDFETNTTVDFTPPHVISTSPNDSSGTIPRNKILQINFSEPIDPTVAEGFIGKNSNFKNIVFSSSTIAGNWKITNGYTTVEFTPSDLCGTNSCGEPMYCLPLPCPADDLSCTARYMTVVRTAELIDKKGTSFAAIPFSGLMDMAGNALDSGPNGVADGVPANPHRPPYGNNPLIADPLLESFPDNYQMTFIVSNKIDRTSPYIQAVSPGLDQEGVQGGAAVVIKFNKPMWLKTLSDGVKIDEYPANMMGPEGVPLDSFGYAHVAKQESNGNTTLTVLHPRDFGPNGLDLYYFASILHTVKSDNQNCLYPGRGPAGAKGTSPICTYQEDDKGVVVKDENCVPVQVMKDFDTGCMAPGAIGLDPTQKDVITCLGQLRNYSTTST